MDGVAKRELTEVEMILGKGMLYDSSGLMLSKLGFLSAAAGVKTGFLDHNKSFFHVSSQLFYCHFFHISG